MLARGIMPKEDMKVVEQSSRRLGLLWRRIRGDSKLFFIAASTIECNPPAVAAEGDDGVKAVA